MQMLRLLDGSEDSPLLAGSKQTPATLRINRELLLSGSSEPPRQQSAR